MKPNLEFGPFYIVPLALHEEIHYKITKAIEGEPEAEKDRDFLYQQLLSFYNENGYLPEFQVVRNNS